MLNRRHFAANRKLNHCRVYTAEAFPTSCREESSLSTDACDGSVRAESRVTTPEILFAPSFVLAGGADTDLALALFSGSDSIGQGNVCNASNAPPPPPPPPPILRTSPDGGTLADRSSLPRLGRLLFVAGRLHSISGRQVLDRYAERIIRRMANGERERNDSGSFTGLILPDRVTKPRSELDRSS